MSEHGLGPEQGAWGLHGEHLRFWVTPIRVNNDRAFPGPVGQPELKKEDRVL